MRVRIYRDYAPGGSEEWLGCIRRLLPCILICGNHTLVCHNFDLVLVPGAHCNVAVIIGNLNAGTRFDGLRDLIGEFIRIAEWANVPHVDIHLTAHVIPIHVLRARCYKAGEEQKPDQCSRAYSDSRRRQIAPSRVVVLEEFDQTPKNDQQWPEARVPMTKI